MVSLFWNIIGSSFLTQSSLLVQGHVICIDVSISLRLSNTLI